MRKPGTDENNVQMTDVVCDYCRSEWTDALPMVEGHQGACICAKCLTVAYTEVVMHKQDLAPAGAKCTMCLEHRDDPGWVSPAYDDVVICKRCIKQAAGVLHKSKDYAWRKPDAPPVPSPAAEDADGWEEEPEGGWPEGDSDEFEYEES